MSMDKVKAGMDRIITAMNAQIEYIEKTGVDAFYGSLFKDVPGCDYWVTTGRGRSGHLADKVSASLASTGTPSYFKNLLDDIAHARLLTENDRVLLFHQRGEPFEQVAQLFSIIPDNVPVDIITDREEGWPDHPGMRLQIAIPDAAPSSVESDVVALALGDSLLCGMESAREFTEIDFLMDHPKGALAQSISAAKDKGEEKKLDYLPAAGQALVSFKAERDGLVELAEQLTGDAVETWLSYLRKPWKRIITTGMGKPGYCMRYLTVLLTELGVASFYLHPAEGVHGDLGRIGADSLVIAYSHSGTTAEVMSILPRMKERGATLLSLTNNPDSNLGQAGDAVLKAGAPEVDPIKRAPTGSTTVSLSLAAALVSAELG